MDASFKAAKSPRKMGIGAKLAIGTVGTLFTLFVGLDYTISRRNELPNILIPVSPEPRPNAYQFFVAAAGEVQDNDNIGFAISNKPGPLYPHMTNGMTVSRSKLPKSSSDNHVYTLAEKEKLVHENQDALAMLRSGFAYQYGNKTLRSVNDTFPEFAKFRAMARLLALESQVKRARGDYSGAARSELDAVQIGVMMPRNGALIADLVGIACEAIGRRTLWDDYSHLDAAQTLTALHRLEKIEALRFPFADVMEEEKRFGQAALLEAFRSPEGVPVNEEADMSESEGAKQTPMQNWAWKMRVKWAGKHTIFENYTRYMDQLIQDNRKSYGLHLPPPPAPSDPVNQQEVGIFDEARIKQVTVETQDRLLVISLALHAYQKSHGAFPPSLDAIRANVSANLLTDPFAAQEDLRYRRNGAKYVLYSVGPDGRDDGGKPIYDKTKAVSDSNERARYFVEQNSVGDVVAGVNK